jgi:hypothetical protein
MPTNTNRIGPVSARLVKKPETYILFNTPIDPTKKQNCMEGFKRTTTALNSGFMPPSCPCLP